MWLSILVLLVLAYVPGLARAAIAHATGMRVARVMIGFGPQLAGWTWGQTRWQLHAIALGTFSQVAGLDATDTPVPPDAPDAFGGRPWPAQLAVLLAGAVGLFVFAGVVSVTANLALGIVEPDPSRVIIDSVVPGSPAAAAGLLSDDELLAVDGTPIRASGAVAATLAASHGPVRLTVRREDVVRTLVATPESVDGARRIGVQLGSGAAVHRVGAGRAIADGVLFPPRYARFVLGLIAPQLGHGMTVKSGSTTATLGYMRDAMKRGTRHAAAMFAMMAVYFSLWLLVPVPPLDGGRVLTWLWSRGRRSPSAAVDGGRVPAARPPVDAAWLVMTTLVGIAALFLLAAGLPGVVGAVAFVGLLRRRPWAWALTRTGATLAAGSPLILAIATRQLSYLATAAFFAAIALLARRPSVRLAFGLGCPACRAVAGEPVQGARRALSCRACGSSWTVAPDR